MFAPHCPTCASRVLLGTRRIVRHSWAGDGHPVIVLRCFCGRLVSWDDEARPRSGEAAGACLTGSAMAH
jgi:hypothetical protein